MPENSQKPGRFGFIHTEPGVSTRHMWVLMYAAFVSIALGVFSWLGTWAVAAIVRSASSEPLYTTTPYSVGMTMSAIKRDRGVTDVILLLQVSTGQTVFTVPF